MYKLSLSIVSGAEYNPSKYLIDGFPGGSDAKASAYTTRETRVQSLGWEDLLEKEMAIHASTIAWKIPWTEEPGGLHVVHGVTKSRTRLSDFTSLHISK